MKMMVKLTVLLATLLLLTGISFADDCRCYSVTCTNLENGMVISDHPVQMCFNYENQEGTYEGFCNTAGNMELFFDIRNVPNR